MKVILVEYFGLTGKGKSLKEAKSDAASQVQTLIKDVEQGPRIVKLDTLYAIIARTKTCWQYQMIWEDGTISGANMGFDDEDGKATENKARVHAAQTLCSIPDKPRLDLILSEYDQKEHLSWFNWHVKYKEARDGGYSDEDARSLASGMGHLLQNKEQVTE